MPYNVRDTQQKISRALPNGAGNVTPTAGIDLGSSSRGDFVADVELLLTAPLLTTAELPNAATMTYDLIQSDNPDLSSPVTIIAGAIVQTGAGGVGAAAATLRYKPPTNTKRYLGFKATNSGAGNASGKLGLLEILF